MKPKPNLWPFGIIAAFGLFFIGMASVVVIAATHREHLVNANYYEQEIQFQDQINARTRARNAGATLSFSAANAQLAVQVPAKQLAQDLSGTVTFYRANTPELDHNAPLKPDHSGLQTFDLSKLATGPWRVRVAWAASSENYFMEEKITVSAK